MVHGEYASILRQLQQHFSCLPQTAMAVITIVRRLLVKLADLSMRTTVKISAERRGRSANNDSPMSPTTS